MHHQTATSDVAMCAEEALPMMLNPRRVFSDNQFRQGACQRTSDGRLHVVNLAPTGNTHVRFNLDVGFHTHWESLKVCHSNLRTFIFVVCHYENFLSFFLMFTHFRKFVKMLSTDGCVNVLAAHCRNQDLWIYRTIFL